MFFGAPFLPTRKSRVSEAVDLLNLKPGQTLLELGSGNGRILREASRRGIYCIGYELNPVLVLLSRLHCWRWRQLVTIHCANYWNVTLPKADGIYVFLLQPYMSRLDKKIQDEIRQPTRLVSFAFFITTKQPTINQNGLFLYRYVPMKHS
jgi:16S rRNA A1518/A1519 N6-dimethyltransferase RsmA/KsgA/DIM1 with predicted DNA glycosylase/AP lyase activity